MKNTIYINNIKYILNKIFTFFTIFKIDDHFLPHKTKIINKNYQYPIDNKNIQCTPKMTDKEIQCNIISDDSFLLIELNKELIQ